MGVGIMNDETLLVIILILIPTIICIIVATLMIYPIQTDNFNCGYFTINGTRAQWICEYDN